MKETMNIPAVGSLVRVRLNNIMGPAMIPPQVDYEDIEGKVVPSFPWLTTQQFCMSGDADIPVRSMDMSTIRNIELLSGSFLKAKSKPEVIEVLGSKGEVYFVTRSGKGLTCSCKGFQFRNACKHVVEVN